MSTYNRLANSKNPFQGEAKRVLCVCSAGLLRSPTAANVLHREFGYNTRAAGCSSDFALIPVDPVLVHWADEIVCVEQSVLHMLDGAELDLADKRVVVLAVPDRYEFMNDELQDIILKQYKDASTMEKAYE